MGRGLLHGKQPGVQIPVDLFYLFLSTFIVSTVTNPAPAGPPFPTGPAIKGDFNIQTKCQYRLSRAKSHKPIFTILIDMNSHH